MFVEGSTSCLVILLRAAPPTFSSEDANLGDHRNLVVDPSLEHGVGGEHPAKPQQGALGELVGTHHALSFSFRCQGSCKSERDVAASIDV